MGREIKPIDVVMWTVVILLSPLWLLWLWWDSFTWYWLDDDFLWTRGK